MRLRERRTFSFSRPGTSHSQRAAVTWLSSASGTVSVTPSCGEPRLEVVFEREAVRADLELVREIARW